MVGRTTSVASPSRRRGRRLCVFYCILYIYMCVYGNIYAIVSISITHMSDETQQAIVSVLGFFVWWVCFGVDGWVDGWVGWLVGGRSPPP
jgi:hypothetical protein